MRSGVPLYKYYKVEEDGQVFTGPCRIMGFLVSADQAASDVHLHDSTSANNEVIDGHATQGLSYMIDLTPFGGVACAVGVYADIDGAGAEAFIWIDG